MDEDNDIDAPYGSQQMRPAPRDIPRLPPRLESGHAMNFSNRERRQEEMEEIAEQLVEDKWKAVEVRLKSVEAKFDGFEKRMAEFEGRLGGVRADVEKKVSESEDVIENYKSDVSEITAKIGSMETVMKDTLGPMMETMRSLSETVKVLKKSHQRPASAIDMLARPSRDTYGSPSTEPDEESQ
jgi:chromosome segregation ATPase